MTVTTAQNTGVSSPGIGGPTFLLRAHLVPCPVTVQAGNEKPAGGQTRPPAGFKHS